MVAFAIAYYKDAKFIIFFKGLYRNYPNWLNYDAFLEYTNLFYPNLVSNISVLSNKFSPFLKKLKNFFKK
jgi:hypothetical protein